MGLVRALSAHLGRPLILLNPLPPALNRLFETQPWIERVLSIGEIERDADHGRRRRQMTQLLRSLELDTLFFFNFKTYAAIAARLAGVPRRVGFVRRHQFHNALLFSHHVMVQKRGTPHPDTHTWLPRLLARHGYPPEPRSIHPSLIDSAEDAGAGGGDWRNDIPPRLIAPGLWARRWRRGAGQAPQRCVQPDQAAVAARDPGLSFLLFGAADVAGTWQRRSAGSCAPGARLLDITGQNLDLRVGSALMARCLGCVSNDSLALHIAAGHRVPSVGLFGISPPMRYVPWLEPLRRGRVVWRRSLRSGWSGR